jgi:hypothetical protein
MKTKQTIDQFNPNRVVFTTKIRTMLSPDKSGKKMLWDQFPKELDAFLEDLAEGKVSPHVEQDEGDESPEAQSLVYYGVGDDIDSFANLQFWLTRKGKLHVILKLDVTSRKAFKKAMRKAYHHIFRLLETAERDKAAQGRLKASA